MPGNKLIVGHSRTKVFFGEYLICLLASLILLVVMLLFSGISGYILFRKFALDWKLIVQMVFCSVLLTAVFSTMFVGISMNIHNKAVSVVVNLVFLFAILFLASFVGSALNEAEMSYEYVRITAEGGREFGDMVKNPAYVEGIQRSIYEFIYYLNLKDDTFSVISDQSSIRQFMTEESFANQKLMTAVRALISEGDWNIVREFLDFGTLDRRMEDREIVSMEFLSAEQIWYRASFISAYRGRDGSLVQVLFVIQLIDEEKRKELDANRAVREAYKAAQYANSAKTNLKNENVRCEITSFH